MNNPVDFNDPAVVDYDEHIARVVPGYALMTLVAVAHCQVRLANNAKILIVGAGTGHELEQLCLANPTWSFVAVEPAESMLQQAKKRCQNDDKRIHWHHGTIDNLEQTDQYDACLCLLVLHFLSDEEKQQLLAKIACMTSGDLLLSQRLSITDEAFLDDEIAHALLCGHPKEKSDFVRNRLLGLPSISEKKALSFYEQCGFAKVSTLVQVFSYQLICLTCCDE